MLNSAWVISLHRCAARASEGPRTWENVSSYELVRLRWHPSESHASKFAYKTAWKVPYTTSSMSPSLDGISWNCIKNVLSARPSRLSIKPIEYSDFSHIPRRFYGGMLLADGAVDNIFVRENHTIAKYDCRPMFS